MRKGWQTKRLGEVASLQRGFDLPTQNRVAGEFPLVSSSGISDTHNKNAACGPGVVTGRSGSIGNVFFIEKDFWPLNTVLYVKDFHGNDPKFVYHLLKEFNLKRFASGAGVPTLNRNSVHGELVSIPSLPEQRRIVAILDEAFAGIDTAAADAEKNLTNARELFESYLNFVLNFNDDDVQTRKLSTLCHPSRVITYGVIKLGEEVTGGVPCLRTSNVRWLRFETDGVKRIAPSLSNDYKRTILQGGEVLVNVRGTLGGVAAVDPTMVGWNVSREVAVVPSDKKKINQSYLAYWIARKASQSWLTGVQKGVAYTGINIADLRDLPVALPDRETQTRIVRQLDDFCESSRGLEAVYQQKLLKLAALKQTIIQKAFAGELNAQPAEAVPEAAE